MPNDPNNYPCGCVATAMAQVMRYHRHPTTGIGRHLYSVTVDGNATSLYTRGGDGLGGPYDWDLMVFEPNCHTTAFQRQAIGALCYDAGLSVNMAYGPLPFGSSAWPSAVPGALKGLFLYSNSEYGHNNMGNIGPGLIDMINPNLDYGHPAILGMRPGEYDGHVVVVDGYGYYTPQTIPPSSPALYHHLNMGWAGAQDAWYHFCSDMPTGFNIVVACVYNIFVSGQGEIISGRVTDAFGNPLSGITVTAEKDGGGTYSATTNDNGIYAVAKIPSASTYVMVPVKNGYDFTNQIVSTLTSGDPAFPDLPGNVWAVDFQPFANEGGTNAIFVDWNASGNNDGANWTDAYNYLQDALSAALPGDIILVAQGTYKPDADTLNPAGTANRHATFKILTGVSIYGGFPPNGCNSWNDRDPNAYPTVLSGDIGVAGDLTDNCYHVVTGSNMGTTAVLDGFTITAGYAWSTASQPSSTRMGGGMYNDSSTCTVLNCIFIANSSEMNGAAMYNLDGGPTVKNCIFRDNLSDWYGGAINNTRSSATIANCIFAGNSSAQGAGGIANYYDGTVATIVNCTFNGNSTAYSGGGIYTWYDAIATVVNCSFRANTSTRRGGGLASRDRATTIAANCTFSGNTALLWDGGGIYSDSSLTVANCIVWDNNDPGGTDESAQIFVAGGTASVTFSCVQDDVPGDGSIPFGGAANGNIDNDPLFVDPNGPDETAGTDDDDLRLSPGSPCIEAGSNALVPADTTDLDNDANTAEPTPLDLAGHDRIMDGDCDEITVVDMGAYEFAFEHFGDFDDDCDLDLPDFAVFALSWLSSKGQGRYNSACDISMPAEGDINWRDLDVFAENWLAGK